MLLCGITVFFIIFEALMSTADSCHGWSAMSNLG